MFKNSNRLLATLIKQSPMYLLISMSLSFLILFVIELFYYSQFILLDNVPHPFNWILGVAIGAMLQLARLAFGIAGASDFSRNKTRIGIAGMVFSLALAVVASFEIHDVLEHWANGNIAFVEKASLAMQTIVWLGLVIEIRLALTVGGSMVEKELESNEELEASKTIHRLEKLENELRLKLKASEELKAQELIRKLEAEQANALEAEPLNKSDIDVSDLLDSDYPNIEFKDDEQDKTGGVDLPPLSANLRVGK